MVLKNRTRCICAFKHFCHSADDMISASDVQQRKTVSANSFRKQFLQTVSATYNAVVRS